ncbi:MAG TPA: hypothetical protein VN284_12900 [Rhizobium sp.]|nr:hypothetical protein [Rhizobium sp.]
MAFGDLSGHPPPDFDAVSAGIISFNSCGPALSGRPHDDPAISGRDRQAGEHRAGYDFSVFDQTGDLSMAKGQVRSNREVRKPKKDKQAAKVESTFANQMKTATTTAPHGSAPKK